jgi:hypothetical protein
VSRKITQRLSAGFDSLPNRALSLRCQTILFGLTVTGALVLTYAIVDLQVSVASEYEVF